MISLFLLVLLASSCQVFKPSFGKVCIQIIDSNLNYTQQSFIEGFQFNNKQVDLFDWYYLNEVKNQLKEKKINTKPGPKTLICYVLSKPAIALNLAMIDTSNNQYAFALKASIGGVLKGYHSQFLISSDSLVSHMIPLNNAIGEPIPEWAKTPSHNTITYKNKNFYVILDDTHLKQLAISLAKKTVWSIENQVQQDLEKYPKFKQQFYYPQHQ